MIRTAIANPRNPSYASDNTRMIPPSGLRPAFTLIELLVGSIIGALVAGGAAAAVSQLSKVRNVATARGQATSRAAVAIERMTADVTSAIRDSDLYFARLSITDGGDGVAARDTLLLLTSSTKPLRGIDGIPEGNEFEVQYRVAPLAGEGQALWRRADTAFDESQDGGGIASAIVEGVRALSITATDGAAWFPEWDSDLDGLPHGVRIEVTTEDDTGKFTSTRRSFVSLDRVPLPPVDVAEESESTSDSSPEGSR